MGCPLEDKYVNCIFCPEIRNNCAYRPTMTEVARIAELYPSEKTDTHAVDFLKERFEARFLKILATTPGFDPNEHGILFEVVTTAHNQAAIPKLYHFDRTWDIRIRFTLLKPTPRVHDFSLAAFYLALFPGCCMYAVSYHSQVNPYYLRIGIGSLLQEMKEALSAKFLGPRHLLCTVRADNTAEVALLRKFKWKKIYQDTNSRTGNCVLTFVKPIKELPTKPQRKS